MRWRNWTRAHHSSARPSRRARADQPPPDDSAELLLRELLVALDLAYLQDVPLLVRGGQQRPLIRIRVLPLHDPLTQVIRCRSNVLKQSCVLGAIRVEAAQDILQFA